MATLTAAIAALALALALAAIGARAAPSASIAAQDGGCRAGANAGFKSAALAAALAVDISNTRRLPADVCPDSGTLSVGDDDACTLCGFSNTGTFPIALTAAAFTTVSQTNLRALQTAVPVGGGSNTNGACLHVPTGTTIVGDLTLTSGADCLVIDGNWVGKVQTGAGNDVVLVQGGAEDVFINEGGRMQGALLLGAGDDCVFADDASFTAALEGGAGADRFVFSSSDVHGVVDGGAGADGFLVGAQDDTEPFAMGMWTTLDALIGGGGDDWALIANAVVGLVDMGGGDDDVAVVMAAVQTAELGEGDDHLEVLADVQTGATYDYTPTTPLFDGASMVNVVSGGRGDDCIGAHGGDVNGWGGMIGKMTAGGGVDQLVASAGASVDGPTKLDKGADALGLFSGAVINGHVYGGAGADNVHIDATTAGQYTSVNGDIVLLPRGAPNEFIVSADAAGKVSRVNGVVRTGHRAGACNIYQNTATSGGQRVFVRDGVPQCTGSNGYVLP